MPATAAIVVTGTEVLEGRVRDRNGASVAARLVAAGVEIVRVTVVGDGVGEIRSAVAEACGLGVDLVVTTGGLGPTHDDRTMEAVALAVGRPLHVDQDAEAMVILAMGSVPARGQPGTRAVGIRKQATVPEGALVLSPPGTAPGVVLTSGGTVVVVLPGPPWECMASFQSACATPPVAGIIGRDSAHGPIEVRMSGVVEADIIEILRVHPPEGMGLDVGVCARPGELDVTVRPAGPAADSFVRILKAAFPGAVVSTDGSEVEEVIGRALVARGETVATAESCTGGSVGARLTRVPGASAWYRGGIVAYDDAVKEALLGVPPDVIQLHGAVSAPCAIAMAAGVRVAVGSAWGVAITGIAGPGGGTPDKPVGLVFVGVSGPNVATARELHLPGDRERIRASASTMALHLLREVIGA
ncbi:MAG: nicotinamide-nucleotide amidohydrolase family protein [Thermoleophilia bacterium]|nr:nicotinamide-nucleotide amidohydrolase family protein [Thermoleophilia bacterium]